MIFHVGQRYDIYQMLNHVKIMKDISIIMNVHVHLIMMENKVKLMSHTSICLNDGLYQIIDETIHCICQLDFILLSFVK